MSQSSAMDPDIPAPSIEHNDSASSTASNAFTSFRDASRSPRISASPSRTPFKTPRSHPDTSVVLRSSDSPSMIKNERRSTPNLQSPRSSSSLSVSRGQTPSRIQLRRVSSNLNPASPTVNTNLPESNLPPQMTADSVAKEYFERELQAHAEAQSKTVVIVHDSCYGHRFSRPRTSKAALSTIVERPERIHATLLGASTAYVRLGERHSDGAYGPHPGRNIKTLPHPPFLLRKTTRAIPLNHPAVTQVHGAKWMEELQIMCDSAESKLTLSGKELSRPIGYGKDEDGNNLPKLHEGDLYLCSETLAALQGCLGGVCDAVDAVFSSPEIEKAFVCIRPPGHHCSSNYPSGFCWLNNVHVGIAYAAINHGLTHAAIIDFDLHHGDGSQTITWEHNSKAQSLPKNAAQHRKTPVGYYSLHDINSYPCEWGDDEKVRNASLCIENAHGQSVWNVHLEPWKSLEHFWELYEVKYMTLLEKAKSFLQHHSEKLRSSNIEPKAAIFLSAGFDASQWEGQGMQRHNVNVPTEFYAKFTSDIVKLAAEPGLGVHGRVISVLEGGYSDRALASGVMSHLCGLSCDIAEHTLPTSNSESAPNALASTLSHDAGPSHSLSYDPQWWHETNLEALEDRVAGNLPPAPKKKDKGPGNYSSPTHASTARMTEVARERNSISAQLEARLWLESADPGPPPSVDWVTASYNLSRILIPGDRQTLSCRHDELNAEATKVRRDRQSAVGVTMPEPRMQLRTRAKAPVNEPEAARAASRTSNRRTTIAAVTEYSDPSVPEHRTRRRSSAASSILSSFQDMKIEDNTGSGTKLVNSAQQNPVVSGSAKETAANRSKMPPPAKKTTTKISSPRRARASVQPTSKATATRDKVNKSRPQSHAPTSRSPSQSRRSSRDTTTDADAMNDLTQELKKVSIKLKMPTPEQHAENQRKAEEARLKKPRVVRKPPVPKVSKAKAGLAQVLENAAQSEIVSDKGEQNVLVKPSASSPAVGNTWDGSTVHQGANGSAMPEQREDTAHTLEDSMQVSYTTMVHNGNSVSDGGRPHVEGSYIQPPPNILTVTDNTPQSYGLENGISNIPKKTRADLPVFTSSSPIPFAPDQNASKQEEVKVRYAPSAWGVPETPHP